MPRFDLYRARDGMLHDTADHVSAALGAMFDAHDSDFIGGEYLLAHVGAVVIKVMPNYRDDEGYVLEPDCGPDDVLVYVSGEAVEIDGLAARLPQSLDLVRAHVIEAPTG